MTTSQHRLAPLGRYGDNYITPDGLFDPTDPAARPPGDVVDVVFRSPVSLGILLDELARAGREDMLADWEQRTREFATETARFVQMAGYGADYERGVRVPARLAVTAVVHTETPGLSGTRWHLHVYVGPWTTSVLDDARTPLDVDRLREAIERVSYPRYANRLEALVTELWGVRWGEPRPGAVVEIVDPPCHKQIQSYDRGVCPGLWGPDSGAREQILADEVDLRLAAESEEQLAREMASGLWEPEDFITDRWPGPSA